VTKLRRAVSESLDAIKPHSQQEIHIFINVESPVKNHIFCLRIWVSESTRESTLFFIPYAIPAIESDRFSLFFTMKMAFALQELCYDPCNAMDNQQVIKSRAAVCYSNLCSKSRML
jgi:hypothetical protein